MCLSGRWQELFIVQLVFIWKVSCFSVFIWKVTETFQLCSGFHSIPLSQHHCQANYFSLAGSIVCFSGHVEPFIVQLVFLPLFALEIITNSHIHIGRFITNSHTNPLVLFSGHVEPFIVQLAFAKHTSLPPNAIAHIDRFITNSQNLHKHTFLDHRYTVAQTEISSSTWQPTC